MNWFSFKVTCLDDVIFWEQVTLLRYSELMAPVLGEVPHEVGLSH